MLELPISENTPLRRSNNSQPQTEKNGAPQFTMAIGGGKSEPQKVELESTWVLKPASSSVPINGLPISLLDRGMVNAELSSEAVLGPVELYADFDIPRTDERALEMESRGEHGAAEDMRRQVVEWRKKVQGPEHLDTLSSMYRLVLILDIQGKYGEAEQLYRQILALRETVLGPNASSPSLGEGLMLQGKYEAAEKMDRQELELNKRVLGPEHRYTLLSMGNLANVLRIQTKFEEAEESYRLTLELSDKVLGPEHNYTLQVINNLGVTLDIHGKREEAKEVYRQSVERNVKKRGCDHPDTCASLHNLRSVLDKNEDFFIEGSRMAGLPAVGSGSAGKAPTGAYVKIVRKPG